MARITYSSSNQKLDRRITNAARFAAPSKQQHECPVEENDWRRGLTIGGQPISAVCEPISNHEADTWLIKASQDGSRPLAEEFLALGAEVNARGGQPVRAAAANGHLDLVKFFVETKKAGVPDMALIRAAANNHVETVAFLLGHVTAEEARLEALETAKEEGRVPVVALLEAAGVKPLDSEPSPC